MKFDIQFDEVRKIAIQIEELAHKLAAETSKEGSRDENSIYVYSAEIARLASPITPTVDGARPARPLCIHYPSLVKIENTFRNRRLDILTDNVGSQRKSMDQ